ncbi:MAG: WecB/TagA/CpsF family glycosyltransferase [Herpetosiphon sp.]
MQTRRVTTILGIPVDHKTLDQAIDRIEHFVLLGGPHQVATVNPEFVMTAKANPSFRAVLQQADLCVADGIGLIIAAHLLRDPLLGRVPGVELCLALTRRAAERGWRIYLLGAAPGVAEAAAARLKLKFPGVTIAGSYAGSPAEAEASAIIERIKAAAPHILLVAYGAPAQDMWIARHQPALGVPVAIGVGGAFDYISGRVARAPAWMCRLGLEWLFRLIRQPWRWHRMLALPRFMLAVARQARLRS